MCIDLIIWLLDNCLTYVFGFIHNNISNNENGHEISFEPQK